VNLFVGCGQGDLFIPCFRCGVCCTKYQVLLNLVEGRAIADGLGVAWDEFVDRYLDQYYPGAEGFLLRRQYGACVFLEHVEGGKLARCLIYSFRPVACREWTPSLYRRECCEGLTKIWGLAVDSLGQLQGPGEAIQDFHSFLESLARAEEGSCKTRVPTKI
jgi:hypothetical protein